MTPDHDPRTRPAPPETCRVAHAVADLRRVHNFTRAEVAAALADTPDRIALYEVAATAVPTAYAGGLAAMCGASRQLTRHVLAPFDDAAGFPPLPADPSVLEIALRLARREPGATEPIRALIQTRLAAAPPPSRRVLRRLGDPYRVLRDG